MKKILGVAAAVALATGAVFAEGEGLKTSVEIQTGLQSNLTEHETYNIRSDGNRNRVNISLNYTGENFGLVTYFRSQWNQKSTVYNNMVTGKLAAKSSKAETTATTTATTTGETTTYTTTATTTVNEIELSSDSTAQVSRSTSMPYLRHAYGYAKLFDGNVKVDAGLLSVETWEDSFFGYSCLQGGGVQLELTPTFVPGLNLGTAFIARDIGNSDKSTVNWDKKHWTAGAKYSQPDGKYTAALGWDGGASCARESYEEEFAWAEFTFWEFPVFAPLSLGVEANVFNLVALKNEQRAEEAVLFVGFDVEKLVESVPLNVEFFIYGNFYQYGEDYRADDKSTKAPKDYQEYEFEGYAAYKVNDKITAKATGAYWISNEDGMSSDDKKQWFGKIGASYQAAKGANLGLYYSHKSLGYNGHGGMEISSPAATGYDFVSLDFVYNF